MGYTEEINEAGVYSKEEADSIIEDSNIAEFNECMIPTRCM